ncbi:XRE family transcriptional regulator [Thalassospiraceae bacterium LMO-JJ14]|nr:XRE family transcriptional regulator [Thalassospiraceae bacterium LMO-JJ14]
MSTIIENTSTPSEEDRLSLRLAARIRHERNVRGWSINELAAVSGVSRAMISRIERAEASPTAALLGKLSGAFGLTMSTLLARAEADDGDDRDGRVSRAGDQTRWNDPETGFTRQTLTPPGADPEMVLGNLPAGARIAYPASAYTFMRGQCVWVMRGRLAIREDEEVSILSAGDCLAFDLATPKNCAFENPSKTEPATYVVSLVRR